MTERPDPASADLLGASLVRLVAGRRLLGTGFTLPGGRVATCAHVIAGFDDVHAQFPLLRSDECAVEVVERDDDADIAILRLVEPPERVLPTPVRLDKAVRNHRFSVFGFTDAEPQGVWVSGSLAGTQGEGRVQMRVDPDHERIVRGFSGAPVWDEELNGVVGMVVTRSGARETTAHLVPVSFLGEWTVDARNPYRGLKPFGRADSTLFHGRDNAIEELLERLKSHDLVAVVGPSGSGKSSLARAGLLPRLERKGVTVAELGPGESPDSVPVADGGTVLFLDQFEESVIADPVAARERLTRVIGRLEAQPAPIGRPAPLRVVLTLRSRSLDALIAPGTRDKLNDAIWLLDPMGQDDLRAAIVRPAEDSGLAFEVGLVEAILHDSPPEHGTLPLLSEALKQLWDRRHGSWLTHAAYRELGRLPGALRDYADAALAHLGPEEAARAKRLLLSLTRPDGDGGHTRRRVELDELDEELRTVADRLAAARLVVIRERQVELPHQALIDHWPTLRGWLGEDEVFLAWSARLQDLRDSGGQLSGAPLAEASDWLRTRPDDIPSPQRDFIAHSETVQRRSQRRWRTITAISVTLALIAVVLTGAVGKFASDVNGQLRTNNARLLAQAAERAAEVDPRQALQLALAAYRENPDSAEAYVALLDQRLRWDGVNRVVGPELIPDADVSMLHASSDGRVMLAYHSDRSSPVLWQGLGGPNPRHRQLPVDPRLSPTSQVALSPDGRMLIVFERDSSEPFRVLDLTDGDRPVPLAAQDGFSKDRADAANFSLNSRFLATLSVESGQPVHVWDLVTGRAIPNRIVFEPNTPLTTVFPAPDGRSLITVQDGGGGGSKPDTVTRWDLATGARIQAYPIESSSSDPLVGNGTILGRCDETGIHVIDLLADHIVAELPGTSCSRLESDLTGQYILSHSPNSAQQPIIHWPTRRTMFTGASDVSTDYDELPALLPGTDDELTAVYQRDGVVRRSTVPTVAETVRGESFISSEDRRHWLTARDPGDPGTAELVLHSASGRVLATATVPDPDGTFISSFNATFDPTGDHIAVAHGSTLRFYRSSDLALESEQPLPTSPGHADVSAGSISVARGAGSEFVVGSAGMLSFWDFRTRTRTAPPVTVGKANARDERPEDPQVTARPGHPGQLLVTIDTRFLLWDVSSRKALHEFPLDGSGSPRRTVVSPDGSVAATGGLPDPATLIDLDEQAKLPELNADTGNAVGFTGDYLFTGDDADGLQIWNWKERRLAGTVATNPTGTEVPAIEGDVFLSDSTPSRRSPVPLDPEQLFRDLCGLSDREFTPAEASIVQQLGSSTERPCG